MARRWILVVDDDPMMLQLMSDFLQGPDFHVTTASDAMQSFIQARDLKPVLIISDMQMPGYGTGDNALKALRKDPRMAGIPFIFVTGMPLADAQKLLPADDPTVRLMNKPVDWERLKVWIKEMTGLSVVEKT